MKRVWTQGHGKRMGLELLSMQMESVSRGIGAYEHESVEVGKTILVFESRTELAEIIADDWLNVSNALDQIPSANTASDVKVQEIKLNMSLAEVENVLGIPKTRIDLGTKLLYKYKDITVEFHDGKVVDVR